MKKYLEGILVTLCFIFVYLWQNIGFSKYSIPAIGFLVFIFILVSFKSKKSFSLGGPINFLILSVILLLFILSTGGINSALFFLLYFLLFAISFTLNPKTVFIFPVGVLLLFWNEIFQGDVTANVIKVASLFLLSPLAYYFGNFYRRGEMQEDKVLRTKERAVSAADEITEDVEEILEDNKEKLSEKEMAKLNDILEETQDLRNEK